MFGKDVMMGESESKASVTPSDICAFSGLFCQMPEFRSGADLTFLTCKTTYLMSWLAWFDLGIEAFRYVIIRNDIIGLKMLTTLVHLWLVLKQKCGQLFGQWVKRQQQRGCHKKRLAWSKTLLESKQIRSKWFKKRQKTAQIDEP